MIILMNPPYNGNLHLKILEEAMKHSDNVINLSPVRWLQDPFKEYKPHPDFEKFKNIKNKIKSLEVIPTEIANKLFNIQVVDLGVYIFDGQEHNKTFIKENSIIKKVLDKIYKSQLSSIKSATVKEESPAGFYNYILEVYGGKMKTGSGWVKPYGYKMKQSSLAKHQETSKSTFMTCHFNTENECNNFYKSTKTNFFCYLDEATRIDLRVYPQFYPYMGNEINPRTGLKGYESEWTDEDFYKFFDLTDDEIKIIESYGEKE